MGGSFIPFVSGALCVHVRNACVRAKDSVGTSWCVQAFFGDIRGNQARHTCA